MSQHSLLSRLCPEKHLARQHRCMLAVLCLFPATTEGQALPPEVTGGSYLRNSIAVAQAVCLPVA